MGLIQIEIKKDFDSNLCNDWNHKEDSKELPVFETKEYFHLKLSNLIYIEYSFRWQDVHQR